MKIQGLTIVWITGLMTATFPAWADDSAVEVTFGFHNRGAQHWRGAISAACAGINSLKNPLVDKTELAETSVYPETTISTGDLVEEWNCPGAGACQIEVTQLWRPGAVTLQLLDASGNVLGVLTDAGDVYPLGQGFGLVKKIRGTAAITAAPKGNKGAFAKVKVTTLKVEIKAEDGASDPVKGIPVSGVEKYKTKVTPDISGTFVWFTGSSRITLNNHHSQTVTVTAGMTASGAANIEDLNVRFTPTGSTASLWDTCTLSVFTVDLKSVVFTSHNSLLRAYTSDYGGDGTVAQRYTPCGWVNGGANNPITHTGDMYISLDETVCAKPAGVSIFLKGSGLLGFGNQQFASTGSDQTLSLTSTDKLQPKVAILSQPIGWQVNGGGSCWVSVGQSGPHKVYVTRGTPLGSIATERRIAFVCETTSGLWDESACVDALWGVVPSGWWHFGAPPTASGWELLDGGNSECLGLAQCMTLVVKMLGISAETKQVCASTDGGVGHCLQIERRTNCSLNHGKEVLSLLFSLPNVWEGCSSAAGHYYALYPIKKATDDYAVLKELVPSEARQYWYRQDLYGYPYGPSCTVPPGEIPVP